MAVVAVAAPGSSAATFDVGDVLPFSASLYSAPPDQGGSLCNADSVTLTVTRADGTTVAPTVVNPPASTGLYGCDVAGSQAGRWVGRWLFTVGSATTAYVEIFDVRDPAYILSLAAAKAHLNIIPPTDTTFDEELRDWLGVCTDVVEELSGQVVARRTVVETRTFDRAAAQFTLAGTPVVSLTSVVDIDGYTTWQPSGFDVDGRSGVVRVLRNARPVVGRVRFTYVAGYQVVPPKFTGAAKVILGHLWESQRSPLGGGAPGPLGTAAPSVETIIVGGHAVPKVAVELIGTPMVGMA